MSAKRVIGLLTLLLTAGLLWILASQQINGGSNNHPAPDQQPGFNESKAPDQMAPIEDALSEPQPKLDATKPTTPTSNGWQEKLLQEIDSRIFSDDPYVEFHSLEFLMGQCRDPDLIDQLLINDTPLKPQLQLAEEIKLKCSGLIAEYPEFLSYPNLEQLLLAFEPQSRMGRLLKQSNATSDMTPIERSELSTMILRQSIKEQNSAAMMHSVFVARFGSLPTLGLADVLGSRDQEYLNQMSSLALMQMACQLQDGMACDSTSFYMILLCATSPTACGLNFNEWYQKITLPGMQRDVEKLVAYFKQFSQ